jgi:hypothetical protein
MLPFPLKNSLVIPQQSANQWSNKTEYEFILHGVAHLVNHCLDE